MESKEKLKYSSDQQLVKVDSEPEVDFVLLDKKQLPSAVAAANEGLASAAAEAENNASGSIKTLPTLKFYQKTYANSCSNNDKKALKIVKDYESQDKIKRLKAELNHIITGKVTDEVCTTTVGPDRKGKYGSYADWAKLMLSFLR